MSTYEEDPRQISFDYEKDYTMRDAREDEEKMKTGAGLFDSAYAREVVGNTYSIQFQKLDYLATLPTRGSDQAAGYDLYASEEVTIPAGGRGTIPLGFATAMPSDIHARIESRSGMALKGYVVLTGVIDADYRGEWKVIMGNFTNEPLVVAIGDRVAQAVLRPTLTAVFGLVETLSETSRGGGGFGSTGTR